MTGVLDRQAVLAVLEEHRVGAEVPGGVDGIAVAAYRDVIATALTETRVGSVQVRCTDMEDYARIHNQGWDAATEQFAELLADARSDLAPEAGASDLLSWLGDTVQAMQGRAEASLEGDEPRMPMDTARNIVNQLADLWTVPVDVRQATNDHCDRFVATLITKHRAKQPKLGTDVVMARPLPPVWGGEESDEGTQIYHAPWDSEDGNLRLWVGPYSGGLNEGWAVTVDDGVLDVVMRCTADQAIEWAKNVTAAVRESRAQLGVVHLVVDGAAVTTCCGRTPFELPRSERITVDPSLESCKQAGDLAEQIAALLYANDDSPKSSWDRAYPIVRRPYLELAAKVLELTNGAGS